MPSRRERRPGLLGEIARDALDRLWDERRSQALTLLGVAWGAAAVVLLLAFGSGLHRFLDLGFKKTGDRYTAVYGTYTSTELGGARPGRPIHLELEDLARARAGVGLARRVGAEFQQGSVRVRSAWRTRTTTISAATPELRHLKVLRVERGRFYGDADVAQARPVAVLGHAAAEVFFPDRDPLGREVQVEGRPLRVIGVLERKGAQIVVNNALHDDMVFVPLSQGQRIFDRGDRIGSLLLEPFRVAEADAMQEELRHILWQRHHLHPDEPEGVATFSTSDFSDGIDAMAIGLDLLLGGVGTVILAMAAVGVANGMAAQVQRRRVELGMRRACGARRRDLRAQLLVETAVVVLGGGALGLGFAGLWIALFALVPLPDLVPPPRSAPGVWLTALAVLAAAGLGAGWFPARRAAAVDPSTALRSQG